MGSIGPDREAPEFAPRLYPEFPVDIEPIVDLDTFSLSTLRSNPGEQARLLEICKVRGFFYLNFNDTSAVQLPRDADAIAHLAETTFKLPEEEKGRYGYPHNSEKPNSILGYKSAGTTTTDAKGTRDTAEFMNLGKDDILDNPGRVPTHLPSLIMQPANRSLIARYQTACHETGLELMSMLANQIGLPEDAFAQKARINEPSDDHVRMTRGPARKSTESPEIQTPGHTDFGIITILFNWLGGLQVWSEPGRGNFNQLFDGCQPTDANGATAEWLWVKPKPGHAIVNLGDAAVKYTGGLLCSGRHRVVPAPGEQGLWPRYSIVYFVRPEDKVLLKRFVGGDVPRLKEGETEEEYTSAQWIARQAARLTGVGVAKDNEQAPKGVGNGFDTAKLVAAGA